MTTNRYFKIFTLKLFALITVFLFSATNLVSVGEPSAELISTQTQSGGLTQTDTDRFKQLQFAQVVAAPTGKNMAPQVFYPNSRSLNNTGEFRALVINVVSEGGLAAPRDRVLKNYEEAARWIHHVSRGQASIKVEMFPRDVLFLNPAIFCDGRRSEFTSTVLNQVKQELPVDNYRFISFMLPVKTSSLCPGGMGELTGILSWNFAFDFGSGITDPAPVKIIAHEWGHNVGLHHHNTLVCSVGGQRVALASKTARAVNTVTDHCWGKEYAGPYSFMGRARDASLTASERWQIGWLRPSEQTTVSDATITLHRDGPVTLAWVRNGEGDIFQLEFVNELARDSSVPFFWDEHGGDWRWFDELAEPFSHPGVLVKLYNIYDKHHGFLEVLDMNPQTTWVQDAPLRAQQSWTDSTGSVTITVIDVVGDSATVHIRGQAMLPGAVGAVTATPLPDLGVVDVKWTESESVLPIVYEVRIFEGTMQREIHLYANRLAARVRLAAAVKGTDYWVSVRAVSELGAGSPSAPTPVRWGQSDKPCAGKKPKKHCK